MSDDRAIIQLYNEEEQQLVNFFEFKRLLVYGRQYALLQPEEEPEQLVTFRVEINAQPFSPEDEEDEVFIYVTDEDELMAVEEAWNKLHS